MRTLSSDEISMLSELGFSDLEANIYFTLLQESNLTGYRIAKLIGKPVPNIYQALESLYKKGAVILEESGKSRRYSALPVNEYLDQLENAFRDKRKTIESQLNKMLPSLPVEGIYHLENIDQVYAKCRTMIHAAREIILIDAFSAPLEKLKDVLAEKAATGVKIYIKAYADETISGCQVIHAESGNDARIDWPCDWLNLVIDGAEHMISFLEKDNKGIFQAVWSRSPFLSMVMYSGYAHEFILSSMSNMIKRKASMKAISKEMDRLKDALLYDPNLVNDVMLLFNKKIRS